MAESPRAAVTPPPCASFGRFVFPPVAVMNDNRQVVGYEEDKWALPGGGVATTDELEAMASERGYRLYIGGQ